MYEKIKKQVKGNHRRTKHILVNMFRSVINNIHNTPSKRRGACLFMYFVQSHLLPDGLFFTERLYR